MEDQEEDLREEEITELYYALEISKNDINSNKQNKAKKVPKSKKFMNKETHIKEKIKFLELQKKLKKIKSEKKNIKEQKMKPETQKNEPKETQEERKRRLDALRKIRSGKENNLIKAPVMKHVKSSNSRQENILEQIYSHKS